jgi:O-antigen/teichoic acid export membrane protein
VTAVIPIMATAALFPQFAVNEVSASKQEMMRFQKGVSRWVSLIYTPLSFGLASISYPLILLISGERYVTGALPLLLISVAFGLSSPAAYVNAKLLGQGRAKPIIYSNIVALLLGVVVSVYTIPLFGLLGAALARTTILSAQTIIVMLAVYLRQELYLDRLAYLHSVVGSTVMFFIVLIIEYLVFSLILLPIYIIIGIAIYITYLRRISLIKEDDFLFLERVVPKQLHFIIHPLKSMLVRSQSHDI